MGCHSGGDTGHDASLSADVATQDAATQDTATSRFFGSVGIEDQSLIAGGEVEGASFYPALPTVGTNTTMTFGACTVYSTRLPPDVSRPRRRTSRRAT